MARPLLLDLFCGAGGAAVGYSRAGFDVIGVDIVPQPHYPFRFVQADALEPPFDIGSFDAVHASPPCQAFTQMSARWRGKGGRADSHPDLLSPVRRWFRTLDIPWIIENVPGAIHHMRPTVTLHGGQFGLKVHRPWHFETDWLPMNFEAARTIKPIGVYGNRPDGHTTYRYRNNGNMKGKSLIRTARSLEEGSDAMGINWMTWDELREAIPPSYTEFLGRQLIDQL